jgi:hypothetical protein
MLLNDLEESIRSQEAKEGKAPSFFDRVRPFLIKSAFGFLSIILLWWIASSLAEINAKIQSRPVLAEIDGNVRQMRELPAGERSPQVIHEHITTTLSSLLWMSNRLPSKYGGKEDPGTNIPGIKTRIPRLIALSALNIVDDNRISTLKEIAKKFPPNMDKGETRMLRIYRLEKPQKTEQGYSVKMTASFWTVGADGMPTADPETFNRIVHLVSVEIPPKEAIDDPLKQVVNGTMQRGLMIDYLEPIRSE